MSGVPPEPAAQAPGAARWGNFPNYYRFHDVTSRISLLPPDLLSRLGLPPDSRRPALDVGCNTGDLTRSLAQHLDLAILGIDIDPALIQRAQAEPTQHVVYRQLDIMQPDAMAHLLAHLADRGERSQFDIAFCFSVSMWIHLNHGDEGWVTFIQRLASVARWVVLEPQPWKCYQTAARRMRKLKEPEFEHMARLQSRDQSSLEQFLLDTATRAGLRLRFDLGANSWQRQLLIFERVPPTTP
eukprot:maker-scaffold25_size650667-snap-gene-5.37 protein:Tk06718 transcript:maker-scaffold25_size650667-snap-gene-5.37-mRNA-1 annotation:"unknown"